MNRFATLLRELFQAAPPGEDVDLFRREKFLRLTLLVVMSYLGLQILIHPLPLAHKLPDLVIWSDGFVLLAMAGLYYLLERKKVVWVSALIIVVAFVWVTVVIVFLGTIRAPTTATYLFLVIQSGFFFGWAGVAMTGFGSSLAVLILILAENAGLLPTPDYRVTFIQWFTYASLFIVTGGLTYYFHWVTRDSLDRAQTEIEVRERAEAELRKLFQAVEQSSAAIMITNLSGIIEYVNPRFSQITGYPVSEVTGQSANLIIRADSSSQCPLPNVGLLMANNQEWRGEYPSRKKDGTIYTESAVITAITDPNGVPTHSLTVLEDITLQKQIVQSLQASEETYRALFESSNDGILLINLQGQPVRANRKALEMLGYTREELFALSTHNLVLESGSSATDEKFSAAARGETVPLFERTFITKSGQRVEGEINLSAIRNADGEVILIQGVVRDITLRKKAEQQIRFQAQLLESVGQAVIVTDGNGRVDFWNSAAEGIYGWTAAEALGRSVVEILPSGRSLDQIAEDLIQLGSGQTWIGEMLVPRKDGSVFWAQVSNTPLFEPNGWLAGVISVSMDISERKKAEEEKRLSESRLNFLLSKTPAAVYSMMIDDPLDVTYISEKVSDLLGYSSEQLIHQPGFVMEHIHPDDLAFLPSLTEGFLRDRMLATWEFRVLRSDGHYRWFSTGVNFSSDYTENSSEVFGYLIDIDNRKQTQEALRQSEEQNRLLFEESPDAIALLSQRGEVLKVNRAFELLTKMTRDMVIGKTGQAIGLLSDDGRNLVANLGWFAKDFLTLESQLYDATGNLHHIESRILPIEIDGKVNALLTSRDISLHKKVEESIRRANDELERALQLKNEFLANMSHELRTPLNAVIGISESLYSQTTGLLNERQLRYVRVIHESGHHLLALINDILDLAKIDAGKIELNISAVNLDSVCQSSMRMVRELAVKKNVSIAYDRDPRLTVSLADERRLKQMIVNLLSNAVKFTNEGGAVGLSLQADPNQNIFEIMVWDTGIGILENDLPRLFKPFTQLDGGLARAQGGTGLGLALVSQMARLHGGSVGVSSEVGHGSRFLIRLPWRVVPAQAPQDEKRKENPTHSPASGRILMVEDTEAVTMVVGDYLEAAGFSVKTAASAMEAITLARQFLPDLILMDLQLPGMNGLEATRRLRVMPGFERTPIIALTALAMPGDRELCLAAGADEYVSKPVNLRELLGLVQKFLARTVEE